MTSVVSWLLVLEEYVGGDDTVDVAGADDDSDDDTALVDAFDVVAAPGEGVGNSWVDTNSAEECARVLNVWVVGSD